MTNAIQAAWVGVQVHDTPTLDELRARTIAVQAQVARNNVDYVQSTPFPVYQAIYHNGQRIDMLALTPEQRRLLSETIVNNLRHTAPPPPATSLDALFDDHLSPTQPLSPFRTIYDCGRVREE